MSSYTKTEFRDECKTRSSVISSLENTDIESFIDIALRAYSRKLPELRISPDNAVVEGQDLYDFPSSALSITKIVDSDSRIEVTFAMEDQGSGNQIRLGSEMENSFDDSLESDYYISPINRSEQSYSGVSSTDTFDIEYTLLHDMDSIADTALEALYYHVLHSSYIKKAGASISTSETEVTTTPASITDRDARGESTQITYPSRTTITKEYREFANDALKKFDELVNSFAYGVRG